MSIEFHCHTLFSVDGRGTPETLVDEAAARGVTALSITEHNHLGSTERAAARAAARGIRYFAGIELDAVFEDQSCHFLGFGVDPAHPRLRAFAERNHACYSHKFDRYFEALRQLGFPWRREDLAAQLPLYYPTHPSPVLNTYVIDRYVDEQGGPPGFADMRREAMNRMAGGDRDHGPGPDDAGRFGRFEEARDAVHSAGGVLLLAHVAEQIRNDTAAQTRRVRAVVEAGADGFEVYHHKNVMFGDVEALAKVARDIGCLVSGGSDCHHAPCPPPRVLGGCGAPLELADQLAAALARRRSAAVR